MMKALLLFALLLASTCVFSQAPSEFNYQGIIRDASGVIMANENITITVSILKGSATGISVFDENHTIVTSPQGIINLNIGSLSDLSSVNFGDDDYYLELKVNGLFMGVSKLLSVPYSLSSKSTEAVDFSGVLNTPTTVAGYGITDAIDGNWENVSGTPTTISGYGIVDDFDGDFANLSNKPITILGYGITDDFNGSWDSITQKPTTIIGYGITDDFNGEWGSLTGTPTTLIGYNISDSFSGDYPDLSNQPGNATSSSDGFMSVSDKEKLDTLQNANIMGSSGIIVSDEFPDYTLSRKIKRIGDLYQGGIVIWVDQSGEHGLLSTVSLVSSANNWSNVISSEIGQSAQSIWDGPVNSFSIIAQAGHTQSASQLCFDYSNPDYGTGVYSDWYLPSLSELLLVSQSIGAITKTLENDGNALTELPFGIYWTSTEIQSNVSKTIILYSGVIAFASKSANRLVIAVRAF